MAAAPHPAGKTLQSIALLYTLTRERVAKHPVPRVRRAIVVCPTSLVGNWDNEITKVSHATSLPRHGTSLTRHLRTRSPR